MARAVGLLFSLVVAGLAAWVSWGWSELYVEYITGPEGWEPPFYLPGAARTILTGVGMLLGFTLASLVYRRALDFGREFISDLRDIPARDKVAVVLGVFAGLGMTALVATLLWRIEDYGPPLVALIGIASVYLGVAIMLSMKEELNFFFPSTRRAVSSPAWTRG